MKTIALLALLCGSAQAAPAPGPGSLPMRLHYFQSAAIKASTIEKVPFVLALSGVQGGKTVAGSAWTMMQIQRHPTGDGLITAPTYKMLQHSTLRKFDAMLPRGWAEFNKAESVYNLRWGGKLFVRSLEDPDSIEGLTADYVWADEAGRYSVKAWENIQARRSATAGPVFLTTTPYGLNWLKHQFYDYWLQGRPEYRVVHFRSVDSPYFPRAEWERAKRDMTRKVFDRKFGGIFTPLEGLIYEDFDADTMEVALMRVPEHWERVMGIDHGHSAGHPAAVSIWASENFRDRRCQVWKVGELKKSGLLLSQLWAGAAAMFPYTGRPSIIYADPAAAQENHELRQILAASGYGAIPIRGATNAVDWGIEQMQGLIKQGRYRLAKGRCNQTKDELSTYARGEGDKIIKENDHLMDADRYALVSHMKDPKRMVVH